MKKYYFPRRAFHFSDWNSWRSSKSRYVDRFFNDGYTLDGLPAIRFGSKVMELLEHNPDHELVKDLPKFPHVEYELTCMIDDEIPIETHPDSCDADGSLAVLEYKTALQKSTTRWTARKVAKQQQISFYQMCLNEKFGHFNKENNYIIEIPTERVESKFEDGVEWDVVGKKRYLDITRAKKLDGSYVRHIPHRRVVTEMEIAKLKEDVIDAANEISDAYEKHLDSLFVKTHI
jgi:hypothetical protein